MVDDRNARIREQAYRLWQQEGEPHGRDREHWETAERDLSGESAAPDDGEAAADTISQVDDDAAAAAPAVGADAATPPDTVSNAAPASAAVTPAPAEPSAAKPGTTKKPAARRKRTN